MKNLVLKERKNQRQLEKENFNMILIKGDCLYNRFYHNIMCIAIKKYIFIEEEIKC